MRRVLLVVLLAATLMLTLAAVANADPPQITPNGPWIIPEQELQVDRIYTNEDLAQKLMSIDKRSDRCTVEVAGWSAGGGDGISGPTDKSFPIYVVKFGQPDPTKHELFIEANVHGGELAGNMAIVDMVQYLAMSNNPDVKNVLDNCVLWFMPMFNPDGAMWPTQLGQDRAPHRQNWQPWDKTLAALGLPDGTQPEFGYSKTALGYDVNRDFWWDLDGVVIDAAGNASLAPSFLADSDFVNSTENGSEFGYFMTPEARTWVKLFKELTPEFLIACHHQGTNEAGDTGQMVQVALLGQAYGKWGAWDGSQQVSWEGKPVNNSDYTGYTGDVFTLGQQVVLNCVEKNGDKFPGVFARYAADDRAHSPACSQGCANINGCGIMLCEVRGQAQQKAMGMQINILVNNFWETFKAFADDSIYQVDIGYPLNSYGAGSNYAAIPVQQRVSNPHQ